MRKIYEKFEAVSDKGQDAALLFLRLILAYAFWQPARDKWSDINTIADWFSNLGIAAPKLSAYLAASTEMAGVFLLALGLATRIITIPLIFTLLVAIKTLHWVNGFDSADNGFEIPLYYILMLFILLTFGPGRISLDYLIKRNIKK